MERLEKARPHKYLRRTGMPKQYHYIYQEPEKPKSEPYKPFVTLEDIGERKPLVHDKIGEWKNPKRVTDFREGKTFKMEHPFDVPVLPMSRKAKKFVITDLERKLGIHPSLDKLEANVQAKWEALPRDLQYNPWKVPLKGTPEYKALSEWKSAEVEYQRAKEGKDFREGKTFKMEGGVKVGDTVKTYIPGLGDVMAKVTSLGTKNDSPIVGLKVLGVPESEYPNRWQYVSEVEKVSEKKRPEDMTWMEYFEHRKRGAKEKGAPTGVQQYYAGDVNRIRKDWKRLQDKKTLKMEEAPRHIILEGGPNRRLKPEEKAGKFKEELEHSSPSYLKPAVKKNINDMIAPVIWGYHKEIPLKDIFDVLEKHGIVPLQEDMTRWSGLLIGREGHTTFELAPVGSRKESVTVEKVKEESGHGRYSWGAPEDTYTPFKNANLSLSWYKMDSGRYEVLSHVS